MRTGDTVPSVSGTCRSSSRRRSVRALALIAASLVVAGCAQDAPQDTWDPAGPNARKIHNLQCPVFAMAGIVVVIVMAAVLYAMSASAIAASTSPSSARQPAWRSPSRSCRRSSSSASASRPSAPFFQLAKTSDTECIVNVTGQQWWWEYDYPSGGLRRRLGDRSSPAASSSSPPAPRSCSGTSRDVIHSYWIPKLNGKRDTVPGRVHTLRLRPTSPASTPVSARSSAGSPTPTCAWRRSVVRPGLRDLETPAPARHEPPGELDDRRRGRAVHRAVRRCHQVNGLDRRRRRAGRRPSRRPGVLRMRRPT